MKYISFKEVKPRHKCFFCDRKANVRIKLRGVKAHYACDDCFVKMLEEWLNKWR